MGQIKLNYRVIEAPALTDIYVYSIYSLQLFPSKIDVGREAF